MENYVPCNDCEVREKKCSVCYVTKLEKKIKRYKITGIKYQNDCDKTTCKYYNRKADMNCSRSSISNAVSCLQWEYSLYEEK